MARSGKDLLPKDADEFRSQEYWDQFFRKRGGKQFEWYGDWAQLGPLVRRLCPDRAGLSILQVGCGNSELSAQMYDDGFENMTNIDFSKVCIMEMMGKHLRTRPKMKWLVMDALAMKFADGAFDIVFDKGALDAFMGEEGVGATQAGRALLSEVGRVTSPSGGRYMCVSLLQEQVLDEILFSLNSGWQVDIMQVPPSMDMLMSPLQPFLVVCQALPEALVGAASSAPVPKPVKCHFQAAGNNKVVNFQQILSVCKAVDYANARRAAAVGFHGVRAGGDPFRELCPGRCLPVTAGAPLAPGGPPRFSIHVVDAPETGAEALKKATDHLAAIFLVPQGRETAWLFSAEEGLQSLRASARAARLVVVALGRGHLFGSAKGVQAELSPIVLPLVQAAARVIEKDIPFMTAADGVGRRALVARVGTAMSGEMIVEDVDIVEGSVTRTYRRLVFADNPSLTQSEVRLRAPAAAGAGPRGSGTATTEAPGAAPTGLTALDLDYLSCGYHAALVACLGLTLPALGKKATADGTAGGGAQLPRLVVVGLGGGQLPTFLATHFECSVHAVELDPAVIEVASGYFGFQPSDRLGVTVGDGVEYIVGRSTGGEPLDAILVDAGSTDASLGMSCPPAAFLEPRFLGAAHAALSPRGVLVVNVVARSKAAFDGATAALHAHFEEVLELDVPEDLNRILVGLKTKLGTADGGDAGLRKAAAASTAALSEASKTPFDSSVDFEDLLEGLKRLSCR